MTTYHSTLAAGRWKTFTLAEQLGNVGSEIHRAALWRREAASQPDRKNELNERATRAIERALELLDLTREFAERSAVKKELGRARELLAAEYFNAPMYNTTLEDLERYFDAFAVAANSARSVKTEVLS